MNVIASQKKHKLGIALSGGGARGIAHLGVLKALFEHNLRPDILSGVSAGAIIGIFIADGYTPDEIFDFIKKKKLFNFSRIQVPKNGLLSLQGLEELLDEKIHTKELQDLKIPLVVGASNLNSGKMEYFEKGTINKIIHASSAIPVLFSPVNIDGQLYADGGIFENLPVSIIRKRCHKLIGIHVNPVQVNPELDSLVKIASRTFHLAVNETVKGSRELCDIFIEPDTLWKYDVLSVKNADELFGVGYEFTKKMILD